MIDREAVFMQLARLGGIFSESRPAPPVLDEYVALALDGGWSAEGMEAAVTDLIRTNSYFPKPAELAMAYRVWLDAQARRGGWLGQGSGYTSTTDTDHLALSPGEAKEIVSDVAERWREFTEPLSPQELEAHLESLGEQPLRERHPRTLYRCLGCRDAGWRRALWEPVGRPERLVRCPCGQAGESARAA